MTTKRESFIEAFRIPSGAAVEHCHCGITYYAPAGNWDWEPGELETLRELETAVELIDEDAVHRLAFADREWVLECSCWERLAEATIAYLDRYEHEIARYITNERRRLELEAAAKPVIPPTLEEISDLLSLVMNTVPLATISSWTPAMRKQAVEWAVAEHIHASDHDDVVRKPMPSFLEKLETDRSEECTKTS